MVERQSDQEMVYFWGLGDLHFRTLPAWHAYQQRAYSAMFQDLRTVWQEEGRPAFVVSPGDIVDTCAPENYILARTTLHEQLDGVPFYPGVGNHEYYGPDGEDPVLMAPTFTTEWDKPLRYSWQAGGVICIMLDYPDPYTLAKVEEVYLSAETLLFLDQTLAAHRELPAIIFLHCPLRGTVLDRGTTISRDYNSLQHFFSPENSQEMRTILERHRNICLVLSGHTHSGWSAPDLVKTEQSGIYPVTYVNLMSPWYTGKGKGAKLTADKTFSFIEDEPHIMPTFAFRINQRSIQICLRDHLTRQWLHEWNVSIERVVS